MKESAELEKQAAYQVATLMAAAARTAPKTRGIDNIQVVANKMKEIARSESRPSFERDANNLAASPLTVVIGVRSNSAGLNCGFCGRVDEIKGGATGCERPKSLQIDRRECNNAGQ